MPGADASGAVARGAPHLGYRPGLDGLRAVAVIAILLYHGGVSWAQGAFLGVDTFFVLSGFLITSLLLEEHRRHGAIRFGRFWARRVRRLLPALLVMLGGVALYAAFFAKEGQWLSLRGDVLATLGYVANWRAILSGHQYMDQFATPSPLMHTWSLAVEEQWYLVWPLALAGGLLLARRTTRRRGLACLTGGLVALALASAVWTALLSAHGSDVSRAYYGTDTRAQELLVGAALATLFAVFGELRSRRARRTVDGLALVGAATLLYLWHAVGLSSQSLYHGGFLLVACCAAAVVASAAQPAPGLLGRALGFAPLVWIGVLSYSIYLWHWPVYVVVTSPRTGLDGAALLATRIALTFALAGASYVLVESPIRRHGLGRVRHIRLAPIAAAAGVAAVIVTTVVATTGTRSPVRLDDLARSAAARSAPTTPTSPAAPTDTRVLVVGDSTALTMTPGLDHFATANHLVIDGQARLGCGITRGIAFIDGVWTANSPQCDNWPQRWAQQVASFKPDLVVVLVGPWDAVDREVDGRKLTFGTPACDAYVLSEFRTAIDVLSASGGHVVLLTAPYYQPQDRVNEPAHWRSAYDPHRVDHLNALYAQLQREDPARVDVVDLHTMLSPGATFTDRIDGVSVRGDGVHFTPAGADLVGRWLDPRLAALAPSVSGAVGPTRMQ